MQDKRVIPSKFLTTPSPIINKLIDYISHTSIEYVPQFSTQTAITFMSHLLGRQYVGDTGLGTSSYALLIAQSGIGKNYCKSALNHFDDLHTSIIGGATSGSGLFTALVRNPNLFIVSDEIGDKFNSTNDLNKSLWRTVREVYNTSKLIEDGYSGRVNGKIEEKNEDYSVLYPCLSILGMTTPKQLSGGMSQNDIEAGTANRFTMINSYKDEIIENKHGIELEPPNNLKLELLKSSKLIKEFGQKSYSKKPELKRIAFSKGDLNRMIKKRRELLEDKNSIYTVRVVEKAMRLSMAYACTEQLDTIPTSFLDEALEYEIYWSYVTKNLSNDVDSSDYSNCLDRFKDLLKANPDGVELRKVNAFLNRMKNMEPQKTKRMLINLVDEKTIEKFQHLPAKSKTGRKVTMFKLL